MRIGIGLPNTIPGTQGKTLIEWARRAEQKGFSALGTLDRPVYPGYDPLIALTAAAAVTERIGLLTNVLLAPTRNPVLLAKEAANVDQLSGGRLTLGLGAGSREDDFTVTGQPFHTRGRRFDRDLEIMHSIWKGERPEGGLNPVAPSPVHGDRVPILIGGMSDQAIERTVKWGVGWTVGGAPPDRTAAFQEKLRRAWQESGREGKPYLAGLSYYALGDKAEEGASGYLSGYYGQWGAGIAQRSPKTAEAIRETVKQFEDLGFDEIMFDPTIAELDQVDRLADAVL